VLDRHAWSLLRRLTGWLDQFKDRFGHRAQHVSLRQYVDGLPGDSARKSMSAMLARQSHLVPSVPALHHACPLGRDGAVAAVAGRDAEVLYSRIDSIRKGRGYRSDMNLVASYRLAGVWSGPALHSLCKQVIHTFFSCRGR
jgi:hypothetical protein